MPIQHIVCNQRCWMERPLRSLIPTISPCLWPLQIHVLQCHIFTGLKHLQGRWLQQLQGQPIPVSDQSFGEVFPNAQTWTLQAQREAIPSHPIAVMWEMSLLASTKSRSPTGGRRKRRRVLPAPVTAGMFSLIWQSWYNLCSEYIFPAFSWRAESCYNKKQIQASLVCGVLLNSTRTEFSGVVLSGPIWLLAVAIWSCLLLLSFCSFSVLCSVALLELSSSSQSRTIYLKCRTRPTSGTVQLHWPVCVPTEVGGKMPADGRTAPSCLLLVPQAFKGTEIEKFKHERLLYAHMSMAGSHRDYWEQNVSSEEQNLTHGEFPTHKCVNALQRLSKSWSVPQSLCWNLGILQLFGSLLWVNSPQYCDFGTTEGGRHGRWLTAMKLSERMCA